MIKVETPEGVDVWHGASVEVTKGGHLFVDQPGVHMDYDPGDWLNIEYQEDNA